MDKPNNTNLKTNLKNCKHLTIKARLKKHRPQGKTNPAHRGKPEPSKTPSQIIGRGFFSILRNAIFSRTQPTPEGTKEGTEQARHPQRDFFPYLKTKQNRGAHLKNT